MADDAHTDSMPSLLARSDMPFDPGATAQRIKEDEARWQAAWDEAGLHRPQQANAGEAAYVLEMWPYPSGDMHMGHVRNYCLGDVFARFWRMQGKRVLHPMGWDALGLPAETQAIKEGVPPQIRTPKNIERMRAQMQRLGLSYDWSRELATYQPEYYRWNQWFFLQMHARKLAYRRQSRVHFCPGCDTVLANEQVQPDGSCWRGHAGVRLEEIGEWAFAITAFAEELLAGLDTLTQWPQRIVEQQRHWLGRSEGATLAFAVKGRASEPLEIFTTRLDTVYGATALFLAPEDPRARALCSPEQRPAADAFIAEMAKHDATARASGGVAKAGVDTGSQAVHPLTGQPIAIWLANFVVADYGTGVVMGVPAHDARDFAFAKQAGLPMVQAVTGPGAPSGAVADWQAPYCDDGTLVGEHPYAGLLSSQARAQIAAHLAARGLGGTTVRWHLRDWGFSRQRYWGTPIPIVHCPEHGAVPVPEADLPVVLPNDARAALAAGGGAPLAKLADFVDTSCPTCGKPAKREVETMDTFVDSAWYFARFLSPHKSDGPLDRAACDEWLPVTLYVGGPEHAVMHLLYFRFFTRVMHALGLVGCQEPVRRLLTQGMINAPAFRCRQHGYQRVEPGAWAAGQAPLACATCGETLSVATEKMSKSKYNGVDPVSLIDRYGADTARLYVLFAAPPEKDLEWSSAGVEGQHRFVLRVWRLADALAPHVAGAVATAGQAGLAQAEAELRRQLHVTLAKVKSEYAERNHFNTAIASLMELVNAMYGLCWHERAPTNSGMAKEAMLGLAQMLSPMAPHVAEHLWAAAGGAGLCAGSQYPDHDEEALAQQTMTLAVQVGGKLRGQVEVASGASANDAIAAAKADEKVARHLADMAILREVYVPGRLINFVVRPTR